LTDAPVSENRQLLSGAYFTQEYALESAALFNPSMVWHPDQTNVPPGSKILIEPSHNTPPMGSYFTNVNFHGNYVMFYPQTEKTDYYRLYALDTYRSLYNRGVDDDFRFGEGRFAGALERCLRDLLAAQHILG